MLPLVLGGLGAVGGGLGGVALAGRYMPELKQKAMTAAAKGQRGIANTLYNVGTRFPGAGMEGAGLGGFGLAARDVQTALQNAGQNIAMLPLGAAGRAAQAVPIAAGVLAGGAALGTAGQLFFPQEAPVDPEAYGSSNSAGARYKTPTTQYV